MKASESDDKPVNANSDIWLLIDLCADFYWQETANFQCTEIRCSKTLPDGFNPLMAVKDSTLWDMGCLIAGRGQSWRQHLTDRKLRHDFKELICKLPSKAGEKSAPMYYSVSGKARFDPAGMFIGYHCFARNISEQVDTEIALRRFRTAMDMSGDMIYLVDRKTMRYIDVNDTAWKNSGMTKAELLAKPPQEALMQESLEEIEKRYDRLIIEGGTSRIEREVIDHMGNQVYLETYSRASSIDGKWIIIGVTRNITRRKQTEKTAQKLHRMYSSLSETNAASLRAVSVDSLYHSVCDAAIKGGKFAVCTIFAIDKTQHLRAVAFAGEHGPGLLDVSIPIEQSKSEGRGVISTAFHSQSPCISNDFLADSRTAVWHKIGAGGGVSSAAAFPLLCGEESVAVLLFYSFDIGTFDAEVVELLQSMADNVSFALESFSNEKKRLEVERVLQESEERFRSLTHLSSDFFWEMNDSFRIKIYEGRILGESNLKAVAELKGRTLWGFENLVCNSKTWDEFRAILLDHQQFKDIEFSFTNTKDVVYYLAMSGEPVFNPKGKFTGYRGITRDVTEGRRISDRIQYLASHDNLTSLPNRGKFNEILESNVRLAQRYKERAFALFFIDVDHFKQINDTYGHHIGDALLREIARRLKLPLRVTDDVARLGGDEFVIIINGVQEREVIAKIARKVLSVFATSIMIDDVTCDITVSIGISVFGEDGTDEDSLLQHADSAMYVAKDHGKNNFQFYQNSTSDSAQAS
jgi:diguanylate cyclase (GGDEF)-like protein/PAS domain S-box-containing protein